MAAIGLVSNPVLRSGIAKLKMMPLNRMSGGIRPKLFAAIHGGTVGTRKYPRTPRKVRR